MNSRACKQLKELSKPNGTQRLLIKALTLKTKYALAKELGVAWQTVHSWAKGHYEANSKSLMRLMELVGEEVTLENAMKFKDLDKVD